jgi:hypothetical protein
MYYLASLLSEARTQFVAVMAFKVLERCITERALFHV